MSGEGAENNERRPLRYLSFCLDCPNPEIEGSIAQGLEPKYGIKEYSVTGELIYGIPNLGQDKRMVNRVEFEGRLVLVDRGVITLLEKAQNVQAGGAMGLIIADNGLCKDDFDFCGQGAGSVKEGGFGPHDDINGWKKINIPLLLISYETAERLKKLMLNTSIFVPGYKHQNMTIIVNSVGVNSMRDEF